LKTPPNALADKPEIKKDIANATLKKVFQVFKIRFKS
jgi:hypothetical protein